MDVGTVGAIMRATPLAFHLVDVLKAVRATFSCASDDDLPVAIHEAGLCSALVSCHGRIVSRLVRGGGLRKQQCPGTALEGNLNLKALFNFSS
jgi:hypothetical protein